MVTSLRTKSSTLAKTPVSKAGAAVKHCTMHVDRQAGASIQRQGREFYRSSYATTNEARVSSRYLLN